MMYLSKSKLGLVLTAVIGTATALGAAPAQSGIQQLGSQRAQQSPAPNKVVIPAPPSNPIPIDTLPFNANQPGYYQLTKNLVAVAGQDGISVNSPSVIIDMNGFRISGNGFMGKTAIRGFIGPRLTVINGQIVNWDGDGIDYPFDGAIISGVECIANAKHGLNLGTKAVVQDCTVTSNFLEGIIGSDLRVSGSVILANKKSGIEATGDGLFVRDCDIDSNEGFGIRAPEPDPSQLGTNPCTVEDCRITGNKFGGVQLPSFAQVRRCFVSDNVANGIHVGQRSYVGHCLALRNGTGILAGTESRVEDCTASENADGFELGDYVILEDCEATDNIGGIFCNTGVTVRNSNASRNKMGITFPNEEGLVEGCTVSENEVFGISVKSDTVVSNNRVTENQGQGILATEGANRIEGNHVTRNGVGIEVRGPRNLIVRNSLDSNGVQMQIALDNVQGPFLKTKGFLDNTNPWANFDLSFPASFP